ncbi:nucleotidyltransferase domain-containing protein [Candidatus Woesearchaeota archaeon]|nr:nucleotidyltransferase domain-containing protein [Candidatus Woesearchaeota archaeon]
MEFKIQDKPSPTKQHYHDTDIKIAYEFAKKVYTELPNLVKAMVLFGSTARREDSKKSDVDMLILIDDVHLQLTPELLETYKIITDKKIAEVSTRLHVVTLKLSTFWEYVRSGDPIAINILRDGFALVDEGFFDPLQALLFRGRIRPTQEAINSYYSKSNVTLFNANWHILQAALDLYWAVIDAAHSALMSQGFIPPSPSHVPDMLEKEMAQKGLIEEKYVRTMKLFFDLMKKITHREISSMSGTEYDKYRRDAVDFVERMKAFARPGHH